MRRRRRESERRRTAVEEEQGMMVTPDHPMTLSSSSPALLLPLWLIGSLLMMRSFVRHVDGFPTGAGDCISGRPAVGVGHKTAEEMHTGTLLDGGFILSLDGQPMDPATNADVSIDVEHTIKLSTTTTSKYFRGVLFRLQPAGVRSVDGIMTSQDPNLRDAEYICQFQPVPVAGITHNSNIDKSAAEVTLSLTEELTSMALEITVVVQNNPTISTFYYSAYTLITTMDAPAPAPVCNNTARYGGRDTGCTWQHKYCAGDNGDFVPFNGAGTRCFLCEGPSRGCPEDKPVCGVSLEKDHHDDCYFCVNNMIDEEVPDRGCDDDTPQCGASDGSPVGIDQPGMACFPSTAIHPDITKIIDVPGEERPKTGWRDSYSVGDRCYCSSNFDHGLGQNYAATPLGNLTIRELCKAIGPGPGREGRPVYNDIQCGNGPANDAVDEVNCPGRIDVGPDGCGQIGPTWNFDGVTLQPSPPPTMGPTSPSDAPSNAPFATPSTTPSATPSISPSSDPTPLPSSSPSLEPSLTTSAPPSTAPSPTPASDPTFLPSTSPTTVPSTAPSSSPLVVAPPPTLNPSASPTTIPSTLPSSSPVVVAPPPSSYPTEGPSSPTQLPLSAMTPSPSSFPTDNPSLVTNQPTRDPATESPTRSPSAQPSILSSTFPTSPPSYISPSQLPSSAPSWISNQPTGVPSSLPSLLPSSSFEPTDVVYLITGLTLIRANDTIMTFSPLVNGTILDVATDQSSASVRAETIGESRSVVFELYGEIVTTESLAPFYLNGDWEGYVYPVDEMLVVGHHKVTATVYREGDGGGMPGNSVTAYFTTIDSSLIVTGFMLVNATSNNDIMPLRDGDVIDLSMVGYELNIRADTDGAVSSVIFDFDGVVKFKKEKKAPFALGGNPRGSYKSVEELKAPGPHHITAVPHVTGRGRGTGHGSLTISFVIVDGK